jgi:hypothetical protein
VAKKVSLDPRKREQPNEQIKDGGGEQAKGDADGTLADSAGRVAEMGGSTSRVDRRAFDRTSMNEWRGGFCGYVTAGVFRWLSRHGYSRPDVHWSSMPAARVSTARRSRILVVRSASRIVQLQTIVKVVTIVTRLDPQKRLVS